MYDHVISLRKGILPIAACATLVFMLLCPADAQKAQPLQLRLDLSKQRYLSGEEIPVVTTLTNVSPVAGTVRLLSINSSVTFEMVEARSHQPVIPSVKTSGPGDSIRPGFIKVGAKRQSKKEQIIATTTPSGSAAGKKGEKLGKSVSRRVAAARKPGGAQHERLTAPIVNGKVTGKKPKDVKAKASSPEWSVSPVSIQAQVKALQPPLMPPPLVELLPGEGAQDEYEITYHLYGFLPAGSYLIRAVYTSDALTVTSPPVAFEIQPFPPQEQEMFQCFLQIMGASSKRTMEYGWAFLRRFPDSVYNQQVRRLMLWSAVLLKDWPTVVQIGLPLYNEPIWRGQRVVIGHYLALGLWHLGYREQAEMLLNDPQGSYYLSRLRQGKE